MVRKIIATLIMGLMFFSVGCNKVNTTIKESEDLRKSVESIYFDNQIAKSIAEKYMEALKSKDLNTIKSLSNKEIDKKIIIEPSKEPEITGIQQIGLSQLGNKAMFKFKVTRAKRGEPIAELEEYYLEVQKNQEEEYKVSKLKATQLYNVFEEKEKLKLRKDDEVEVNTLIDIKSIPDKAYPKVNVIDITKVDVPKDAFSAVEIAFSGDKVAISTYKGEDSYIGVIDVDDAKKTAASEGEDEGKKEDKDKGKPLGKNLTTLDILSGCKISSLNFSDDDGYVVANYVKGNSTRFKVYQSRGDIVALELDDIFAENEYNLIYEKIKDNNIIMNVTPTNNSGEARNELTGRYKISLKDFKLQKL
ncbi:hypothetical protein [Clostridium sp. LIBA-8841]|uniref:hypothetical protein n=1 Tax=Clostridium sp. LIBA-8841 TaxID=2987530 RepID=UPI002AC71E84|nr:hypothetical protein [Clostridium sp. LIBA-8841]MDZ5254747.1 hypothetical protein [Clostridium sp. LIBA-8841]